MKRLRKNFSTILNLPTIRLEGGLFLPDQLEKAALGQATQQTVADYNIPIGLKLKDEYSRAFQIASAQWKHFAQNIDRKDIDPAQITIKFICNLLKDALNYQRVDLISGLSNGDRFYPITLLLDNTIPVVIAPHTLGLDDSDPMFAISGSGVRKKTAFQLAQEFINASADHLWAIVTNGKQLRLLRDAATLTRPSFLEFDLQDMLDSQRFAEFEMAWRILHASRAGIHGECIWEIWRDESKRDGTRVRDGLRQGVTNALIKFGNGFIQHPANDTLRLDLLEGRLSKEDYFQQLLRLIYRLIFLFTVEDRDILHTDDNSIAAISARKAYAEGYALAHLRHRCLSHHARNKFDDQWHALRIIFRGLANGESRLALPALGGLFNINQCANLDFSNLSNASLLDGIKELRWSNVSGNLAPVDYRNMGTEELGSVYESLLELVPEIDIPARCFDFVGRTSEGSTQGNSRKTTGSYYTPDSLVQELIKSALDPVIEDRLASNPENPIEALLAIKVIDPACGSGHFLLAAARRLAEQLATLRAIDGAVRPQDYRHCLREVISKCIFGVDRNPMAIELARTALWLEGFEEGAALSFLDHHLICGDALIGLSNLNQLKFGIPNAAFKPLSGDDKTVCREIALTNREGLKGFVKLVKSRNLDIAIDDNAGLSELEQLEKMPDAKPAQATIKETAYRNFLQHAKEHKLGNAADLFVGAFLAPKSDEQAKFNTPTSQNLYSELYINQAIADDKFNQAECLKNARQLCVEAKVFHWPLIFPQVFAQGGFDCVLGNPPWEVSQLSEEEYFSTRIPQIAALSGEKRKKAIAQLEIEEPRIWKEYLIDKRGYESSNNFYRESERFPLTAIGKINTYPLFSETISQITAPNGRAGFIVPTGIATDDSTKAYFGDIAQSGKLGSLYDFENREAIFADVHRSYKFCLLTLGQTEKAEFAFFLTNTEQLKDQNRRFALTADDFKRINPNTLTCPVFRSNQDAELTRKIYQRVPVLIQESPETNHWGITFRQGLFNMTSDSHLFKDSPDDERLPLYEAKMIHQFDHRWASYQTDGNATDVNLADKQEPDFQVTPRYWVEKKEVEQRLNDKNWQNQWLMGWRNIARSTDERSFISSVMPIMAVGHSMPLWFLSELPLKCTAFLANMSALVFDFIVRQKLGGTNMTFGYYKQFPILPPDFYNDNDLNFIVPRVLELTYTAYNLKPWAEDLGYEGEPFLFDPERRAILRAELDAWYAKAYGLTRDELRYILDPADVMGEDYPSETFRVLKNNEIKQFGEYRTRRLVLEAWDKLENGELH